MTAETDLLPCPWCGEKLASVSVSEGSTFRWRKVDGCCADGPEVRHDTMADDQVAAEAESRAAAITAWNTRANVLHPTAAKDAEIAHERWLREQAENRCAAVEDQREALREQLDWAVKENDRLLSEGSQITTRAERLAEALRKVEHLLSRTPKITRDIYVGRDRVAWGVHAAGLLAEIKALLRSTEGGTDSEFVGN